MIFRFYLKMALSLRVIKGSVSPKVFEKALSLVELDCVCNVEHTTSQKHIYGEIRDKDIQMNVNYSDEYVRGSCNCHEEKCPHIAALALSALRQLSNQPPFELKPITSTPKIETLPYQIQEWIKQNSKTDDATYKKTILLSPCESNDKPNIAAFEIHGINIKKGGIFGASTPLNFYNFSSFLIKNPTQNDMLYREIRKYFTEDDPDYITFDGRFGAQILQDLLDKNLLVENTVSYKFIAKGEDRDVAFNWTTNENGLCFLKSEEDLLFFCTDPVYYWDIKKNCIGLASSKNGDIKTMLKTPPLPVGILNTVAKAIEKNTSLPKPPTYNKKAVRKILPKPIMALTQQEFHMYPEHTKNGKGFSIFDMAFLSLGKTQNHVSVLGMEISFQYGDVRVPYESSQNNVSSVADGILIEDTRNIPFEEKKIKELDLVKFKPKSAHRALSNTTCYIPKTVQGIPTDLLDQEQMWMDWVVSEASKYERRGWTVDTRDILGYNILTPDTEGDYIDFNETTGMEWFSTELGITVDGQKMNIVPMLVQLLKSRDDILKHVEKKIDEGDKHFFIKLEKNQVIPLPIKRAHQFLMFLQDLFHRPLNENGHLILKKNELFYLSLLEKANEHSSLRWKGPKDCLNLAKRLSNFSEIPKVPVPKTLQATLRHYQEDGFSWMMFLKEHGLSGILADDMGLGKTVQTLAYIAKVKEDGDLYNPILIVAPTSLMVNWAQEIKKFAPSFTFLVLHGKEREEFFDEIQKHDIVLTTYPLLYRDHERLLSHQFHTIILDEAQLIKNAKAQATLIVQQLKAYNRFCLSGTPLENHLGELWSLFHFLMPGFLGSDTEFKRMYRRPIEKENNEHRKKMLLRRIKPFVLRRTKDQVVLDLPPKTEIILKSSMEKDQRDLYETVRSSLHKKVRDEIAKQGFEKSQIIILDALLKLRQICCDPRLLKTHNHTNVKESAKLEQLMDILKEMIEEGRKILLFSQFSSMIELLEERCVRENISYVTLTGQTKNRKKPIETFQNGEVSLFLISLKAGGTGLNLTTADTVIHYDPWWNPSVEKQATDRAHRIGQTKKVFVYKMICEGSVEEKILELQAKKGALAQAILDGDAKAGPLFTKDDLDSLFSVKG